MSKESLVIARIKSKSMEPTIKKGELVLLNKKKKINFKVGDLVGIVHVREEGTEVPLIHRVIKLDKQNLTTAADANLKPDPIIKITHVLGKVTSVKVNDRWKKYGSRSIMTIFNNLISLLTKVAIRYPKSRIIVKTRRVTLKIARKLFEIV